MHTTHDIISKDHDFHSNGLLLIEENVISFSMMTMHGHHREFQREICIMDRGFGVGLLRTPFINFSAKLNSDFAIIHVRPLESHPYILAGVATLVKDHGTALLTVFPSQFKFDGNFVLLSLWF